jgi:hypothetical protein
MDKNKTSLDSPVIDTPVPIPAHPPYLTSRVWDQNFRPPEGPRTLMVATDASKPYLALNIPRTLIDPLPPGNPTTKGFTWNEYSDEPNHQSHIEYVWPPPPRPPILSCSITYISFQLRFERDVYYYYFTYTTVQHQNNLIWSETPLSPITFYLLAYDSGENVQIHSGLSVQGLPTFSPASPVTPLTTKQPTPAEVFNVTDHILVELPNAFRA